MAVALPSLPTSEIASFITKISAVYLEKSAMTPVLRCDDCRWSSKIMNISQAVIDFANLAIKTGAYEVADPYLSPKLILDLLVKALETQIKPSGTTDSLVLTDILCSIAKANGRFDDTVASEEVFQAKLMNLLTPTPAAINRLFKAEILIHQLQRLTISSTYRSKTTTSKHAPLPKTSTFTRQVPMVNLKSRLIYQSPEKDPKQIAIRHLCRQVRLSQMFALHGK